MRFHLLSENEQTEVQVPSKLPCQAWIKSNGFRLSRIVGCMLRRMFKRIFGCSNGIAPSQLVLKSVSRSPRWRDTENRQLIRPKKWRRMNLTWTSEICIEIARSAESDITQHVHNATPTRNAVVHRLSFKNCIDVPHKDVFKKIFVEH
jgi:hypothetical protein